MDGTTSNAIPSLTTSPFLETALKTATITGCTELAELVCLLDGNNVLTTVKDYPSDLSASTNATLSTPCTGTLLTALAPPNTLIVFKKAPPPNSVSNTPASPLIPPSLSQEEMSPTPTALGLLLLLQVLAPTVKPLKLITLSPPLPTSLKLSVFLD